MKKSRRKENNVVFINEGCEMDPSMDIQLKK